MDKKVYSIKQAAIINAIGKYSKVILSIVVEVVLARLLTPHDYGVVAVVTVFTTFFAIFSDMGKLLFFLPQPTQSKASIDMTIKYFFFMISSDVY